MNRLGRADTFITTFITAAELVVATDADDASPGVAASLAVRPQ